jgi:alcohol dehydrogenase class IV
MLSFNLPSCIEKLAYVSKQVLGDEVYGLSKREAGNAFICSVKTLLEDMELPISLEQWNVPGRELDEFAEYIFKDRQHVYGLPRLNPRKLTLENMKELMHHMHEGTLLAILKCSL